MTDMKRRNFIEFLAAGSAYVLSTTGVPGLVKSRASGFPRRPNVILIMTDDQGYGELGCHGNTIIRTPNLDRFYKESVRFRHFYVSPTCSPTRAALLTGRHEFRCGISHTILGRSLLREDEVTIADVLTAAGYKTGIFGKWHLGDNYPCRPMDRGFHECLYHGGGGITQTPDYWGNTYFDPTLNHNGTWKKTSGYCTDVFFEGALTWIEHNRDNPFFAYITPNAPHEPLEISENYSMPYEEDGLDPASAKYYGMITNIDENVGRLVARIRSLGLEEKTLIIFMTDNGSSQACRHDLYNAGMRGCKGTAREGGVRVPCFFRWPGTLQGGTDIEQVAAHIDMLPTLADLCGASLPQNRHLDGLSVLPLLIGENPHWQDRFLITHVGRWPSVARPPKYENCSVRSQKFRLVDNRELYDMEKDPGETINVIDNHSAVVTKMREYYDRWWNEVLPRLEIPQRIKLGAQEENPVMLTCMDWRPSLITPGEPDWRKVHIWRQDCLAALATYKTYLVGGKPIPGGTMGSWAVEIARSGKYAVILRKLPPVAPPEWNTLNEGEAHMICGKTGARKKFPGGVTSVTFEVLLEKGEVDLECWFDGQRLDREPSGAYFVEVKYL